MADPVVLIPATDAVTLDYALLSMSTFPNGCDFRLRFEGRRVFLEYGCYGVHVNLTQGANRALMKWLDEAPSGGREIIGAMPETIMALKARKPCLQCGGFTFRETN